jgi:sugar lactone lactonase YvrE
LQPSHPVRIFECQPFYEPESEALRYLPEGPRLLRNSSRGEGQLGWVAIQHSAGSAAGSFSILDLRTRANEVHPAPARIGFFAETTRPDLIVLGLERDLALYDVSARRLAGRRIRVTDDPRVIINDGMAIPGGLLFGTKHLSFSEPVARVYWFEASTGRIREMPEPQVCSNGKFLFVEEGRGRLVDICSASKQVTLYDADFSAGRMDRIRVVADLHGTPLFPDGLRPTPDGESVIVAFYNPEAAPHGVARQFRIEDGAVEAEWRLPGSPRVTCPEWIELDGETRIVFTTAIEGMPEAIRASSPRAGALFLGETGFSHSPPPPPLIDPSAFLD